MLNNIGLPGILFLLVVAIIWIIPLWRLLPKFGMSKWLSLVVLVPIIGSVAVIVFVWIMAFRDPVPNLPDSEVFS